MALVTPVTWQTALKLRGIVDKWR